MGIPILSTIMILISPIALWISFDFVPTLIKIRWFYSQSFFIYAVHVIPTTVIMKILAKVSHNDLMATLSYIITPWIVLVFIYIISKFLSRFLPSVYKLLCGGR
jgi:hypothetical protein